MRNNSVKNVVVGFDAGTTKLACVAIDAVSSEIIFSKSIAVNAYIPFADPLRKEQDIQKIEKVFVKLVNELFVLRNVNVLSIGFTGQMHGVIGLDAQNKPITNLVTWEDKTGNARSKKSVCLAEYMCRKAPGVRVASGYGLVTLYKLIHIEKKKNIRKIISLPDYLAARLTGKITNVIDPTFAHSFGAFDLNTGNWDKLILKKLGIILSCLPEVIPTCSVCGFVNKKFSASKIPVSVSIGDNQASFAGSVKDVSKSMLINIGTSAQICYLVSAAQKKSILKSIDGFDCELRPFDKKNFLVSVNLLNGGNTHRLLYDFFAACGRDLFGIYDQRKYDDLWEVMQKLALKPFLDELPVMEPLFNGLRSNPGSKGSISGLNRNNFTPQALIKSVHAGMAHHYKSFVKISKPTLVGGGNGIRKNPSLRKEIEKAFGQKLILPDLHEEAAVGAATWFADSLSK